MKMKNESNKSVNLIMSYLSEGEIIQLANVLMVTLLKIDATTPKLFSDPKVGFTHLPKEIISEERVSEIRTTLVEQDFSDVHQEHGEDYLEMLIDLACYYEPESEKKENYKL